MSAILFASIVSKPAHITNVSNVDNAVRFVHFNMTCSPKAMSDA